MSKWKHDLENKPEKWKISNQKIWLFVGRRWYRHTNNATPPGATSLRPLRNMSTKEPQCIAQPQVVKPDDGNLLQFFAHGTHGQTEIHGRKRPLAFTRARGIHFSIVCWRPEKYLV